MNNSKQHNQKSNGKMIHLRVFIDANGRECKISMEDDSTLEQYFAKKIDLPYVDSLAQEIHSILEHSSHIQEGNDRGFYKGLQDAGQQLYHALLPLQIKEKISGAEIKNLSIIIDDSLIGIPWEIMHDGEEFLSLRFAVGRRIFTSHSKREKRAQKLNSQTSQLSKTSQLNQIKMAILANPTGDLPRSYEEGIQLSEALKQLSDSLDVYFSSRDITIASVSRQLLDCDILHYAGHAVYNNHAPELSGWCLKDGTFTAQKIMEISGGKRNFPSLIFSNACQSGQTTKWTMVQPDESKKSDAFDLVNAFLRCGVRHYISPLRNISDPSSLDLAQQFYNFMLDSYTIGESLRLARAQMIEKHGSNNLIWAHYVLYGNPAIRCIQEHAEEKAATGSTMPVCASNSEGSAQKSGIKAPVMPVTGDSVAYGIHEGKRNEGHRRTGRPPEMERSPHDHNMTKGDGIEKCPFLTGITGRQEQDQETYQKPEQEQDQNLDQKQEQEKKRNTLLIGSLILFSLIILFAGIAVFVDRFMKPRDLNPELAKTIFPRAQDLKDTTENEDSAWEEKKWEIIERIQDRMRQRFSDYQKAEGNESQLPPIASGLKKSAVKGHSEDGLSLTSTVCIIPEKPQGKGNNEEGRITNQLIKELYRFWIKQPEYIVVERDRLDFVMRELELAASPLSENKLRLAMGGIFGSKGILFVRVFIQPSRSLFFSAKQETRIYLHYVDTETTAVKAIAEATLAKDQDLRSVSDRLGDEIMRHLNSK